ncbi:MAG TPA: ADP-ribosylglycohydrolase family protein [Gemmataceae bacterium]
MQTEPFPPLPADHADRLGRLRLALEGLSVGDAFGGQFFIPANRKYLFGPRREAPPPPWGYTDDTEMALGIAEVLARSGSVEQDELARNFARRYHLNSYRGYGPGMHRLLPELALGKSWRDEARKLFGGTGSFGNGGAMRVAPVAGYFADDLARAAAEAARSAEVTHCHPEGVAGAVAVAVAGAFAWQARQRREEEAARRELFGAVLAHTPPGETREGIERAAGLDPAEPIDAAVRLLGNGSRVTAADTVPFCLWCAARHLHQFSEALWTAVRAGGDIDTTGAIIGGIVALAVGEEGIPAEWVAAREELLWEC